MHQDELTLRDYLNIFLRRWWVVALCTVGCLAAALLWTARQTPLYESSAAILINQTSASDAYDPLGGASPYSYADRQVKNEARFLGSDVVSEAAIAQLGYEAYVDVTTDNSADILTVSSSSDDAAQAQEIAQTYAETYVEVREQRFRSDRVSTSVKLAEQLADVDLQLVDAVSEDRARLLTLRRDLADSLDLLSITLDLSDDTGAQVIDNADLPESPYTPRVNRNVALGGVLGLMLGAGIALGLESLDRSVRSRAMLESLTPGAPNLAAIPALKKSRNRSDMLVTLNDPTGPAAEAFRTLRASLQYVAVDDDARIIQIASAHSADGKTTVSANLALALAQAGRSVAVIDADLRRPRIHELFGVPQVPGLTSAIIGSAPLDQCVQKIPGAGNGNAWVMPSGPLPPGPSELLGSKATKSIITKIAKLVDFVIIDTPPVLAVADTVVLSQHVHASILVVDAKKTTRADVVEAFERLQQAGSPVVGTVLNKVSRRPGSYGYGYGYDYGSDDSSRSGLLGWFGRGNDDRPAVQKLGSEDSSKLESAMRQRQAPPKTKTPDAGNPSAFSSSAKSNNGGATAAPVTAKPGQDDAVSASLPRVAVERLGLRSDRATPTGESNGSAPTNTTPAPTEGAVDKAPANAEEWADDIGVDMSTVPRDTTD